MLFCDFDNDGDQDCFAGLDVPLKGEINNIILKNDGKGHFIRIENSGIELKENMYTGTACAADFNNDGKLDLFIGNGHSNKALPDMLFKGNGDLTFTKVANAFENMKAHPTNGVVACDYDNDGVFDISVSRESKYDKKYDKEELKSWFGLYKGLQDGKYDDYTFKSGINDLESKTKMKRCQNFAWFDYNVGLFLKGDKHLASGETVIDHTFHEGGGGKGSNQRIASAKLGADSMFIGCIGNDKYGKDALELYRNSGVSAEGIIV